MKIFQLFVIFLNFTNVTSLINNICFSNRYPKSISCRLTNKVNRDKLLILKEKNQIENNEIENNEYILNVGTVLDVLHRELPLIFVLENINFNIFSQQINVINSKKMISMSKPMYISSIKFIQTISSLSPMRSEINVRKIEYIEDMRTIQCLVEIITPRLASENKWEGMFYFGLDERGLIYSHTFDRKISNLNEKMVLPIEKIPWLKVKYKNIFNKCNSFLKIIRFQSIAPTFLLCFTGGWMINPSITNLLHSTKFIVSTIDTILIMSASMVLNDIYDLEIDRINSPNRPLVNGEIKISEAILLVVSLLGVVEYLTLNYLSETSQLIIQLIIIKINVYTPILKRILIIKNISCASLVAFSLFFTGLSITNTIMVSNKNFSLLLIAMSIIFFGSWSSELILDMRDIIGDKKNKIATIPTIFGNKNSWIFTNIVLYYGIVSNTLSIAYLYNNYKIASVVTIILSPLLVSLYNIKKENYSNKSITNYMKYSNVPLVVLLFYLCLLAKLR